MDGMDWWLPFSASAAACLALVYVISIALGRGPRLLGWGPALVPVTALWLWALGITAPLGTIPTGQHWQITVLAQGLFGIHSQVARFLLGLSIVAVSGACAALAPRRAGYLAAAGLAAFALYETLVGVAIVPRAYNPGWYDWFFIGLTRLAGWPVVLAAAIGGFSLTRRTIVADVRASRASRAALTDRVERLAETRAEAVDAAAAELRRLERDLHDGAQARLVALGINLRTVERLIRTSPDAAEALIADCRETSSQALADLRDLVRGIYPPVLADRGLGDAVRALALDCPLPVVTEIDLPGRPPAPVESAVYFAVAEALNNVAKHADATHALIRMRHAGGLLRAEITDDGNGGAVAGNGTGLAGIERRLGAFDGILAVNSPVGGPTIVIIEVPCALSSPKISTC
jgi:signal transduction histidine kinase